MGGFQDSPESNIPESSLDMLECIGRTAKCAEDMGLESCLVKDVKKLGCGTSLFNHQRKS